MQISRVYEFEMHLCVFVFQMNFWMFDSRECAEGGRVIVEVDDKVTTVRNVKVCLLFSYASPVRILVWCFAVFVWPLDHFEGNTKGYI